jgi:hypothetical protein
MASLLAEISTHDLPKMKQEFNHSTMTFGTLNAIVPMIFFFYLGNQMMCQLRNKYKYEIDVAIVFFFNGYQALSSVLQVGYVTKVKSL